ncbi:recombinase family protein [Sporanaerobacter acetigenes]|uniref:recombinase family protein n=1 Tax=Sporanaerobacter acetigenes TaxID=165813 RepID=UPI00332164D4
MQTRQMKIIDESPTAAIYARKSKATEKGESIENQISRCISLCDLRGWGYVVFQDYDVSGATLDRPDFELMMKQIYKGEFQYLVCYKLDRVSRSTSDFSNLINELDSINVPFISIKENFDLTTPMGRAMMMITAVFAQLERETIAERVRDNMIDRAKLGKWNGGPIPYGFDVKKDTIQYKDRTKKISKLIINKEESDMIKEFYEWYLTSGGSIRSVVTKANELGYKTKNRAHWSHNQVSRILQNPLYCIADANSYNYFKDHTEVNIVDEKDKFDGTHGLMYYNRRKPHKKTTRERDEEDWILAIGEHIGIIPGEIFSRVQMKLANNKRKAPREGQSERSPLAGLVRCGRCGAAMSVFSSPKTKGNSKVYYHYFRCLTREQKARILCDNTNVRADILEDLVLFHITSLVNNKKSLQAILEATNNDIEDKRIPLIAKRNKLQSKLDNLDTEINNLVEALGKDILPELVIKRKYKELENKKNELRNELEKINIELNNNYVESYDLETVVKHIENFKYTYEYLDFDEKKKFLQSIVKEIIVDKNKVKLVLYFLPGKDFQDLDSQTFCSCTDMDSY